MFGVKNTLNISNVWNFCEVLKSVHVKMHGGYTPCLDSARRCLPADIMCGELDSPLALSCAPWLCVGGAGDADRDPALSAAKVQLLSCRTGISASMGNIHCEALLEGNGLENECDVTIENEEMEKHYNTGVENKNDTNTVVDLNHRNEIVELGNNRIAVRSALSNGNTGDEVENLFSKIENNKSLDLEMKRDTNYFLEPEEQGKAADATPQIKKTEVVINLGEKLKNICNGHEMVPFGITSNGIVNNREHKTVCNVKSKNGSMEEASCGENSPDDCESSDTESKMSDCSTDGRYDVSMAAEQFGENDRLVQCCKDKKGGNSESKPEKGVVNCKPVESKLHFRGSCGQGRASQEDVLNMSMEEYLQRELGSLLGVKMLEQILRDMYIDPELLEELDDEQKQILFCKMREEQVRRWKEREQEEENKEFKQKNKNKKGCNVDWLLDADQKPWTWVMGEHGKDKSIEEILEEEAQQKADERALLEAHKLEQEAEEKLRKLKEEEERLEEERRRKEEELRRQEEEAALYQSLKEAKAAQKKIEEEKKKEEQQRKKLIEIKRQNNRMRRQSSAEIEGLKTRRSSEIYTSIKDVRKRFEKEAEHQSKEINREWKKQEEKAKRIESHRREVARKARQEYEEYRRSLVVTSQVFGKAMMALKRIREQRESMKERPDVPSKSKEASVVPKAGRPSCREAIVDWFKETERPKRVGVDPKTKKYFTWFHGMITRANAEELLEEKEVGTYLIRVSERIFGYAISYRDEERCKHYLINALEDKYQFFGSNQVVHKTLQDLVTFHKTNPVSGSGGEKLKFPCGQVRDPPDYRELIDDTVESTKL